MIYRGHVKGGVVVLDGAAGLPEGTEVRVEPVASAPGRSLAERLKDVIGSVTDLPEDMAAQHDHYIHGTPRE